MSFTYLASIINKYKYIKIIIIEFYFCIVSH
jgi:hypothetical protein